MTVARPETAVILAAGEGRRLAGVWDRPKGLLRFGRETLIERSLRLLRSRGLRRIVVVTGFQAEAYAAVLPEGVEIVSNPDFATTGSMASLARALEVVKEDFLLLESDLAYEARALDAPDDDAARELAAHYDDTRIDIAEYACDGEHTAVVECDLYAYETATEARGEL